MVDTIPCCEFLNLKTHLLLVSGGVWLIDRLVDCRTRTDSQGTQAWSQDSWAAYFLYNAADIDVVPNVVETPFTQASWSKRDGHS